MNPIFASIALTSMLFFSSCNKKYTCKCTTTLTEDGYYPHKTETIKEISKNSSKKKATQICSNTAKQMQANTRLLWPDYVQVGTACELRDY
jgi:hypothetical protein